MSVDTINYLNKQKKKLAFIFTVAIFVTILILETSFLIFKYVDYKKQQFQRLNNQLDIISRIPSNSESAGPMWWPNMRLNDPARRARSENLILIDISSSKIIFSSLNDSEIAKEIISKADSSNSSDTLDYNWVEFFFLSKNLSATTRAFIFTQSKVTSEDVFEEFLEYTLLLLLFSVVLYYLWYRFVSYNLIPVEENIKDMEQFIFNAGHELKTPLAVMKSSLELAKAKNDYKDLTSDTINEIWKMNRLIESLINLSTIKKTESSEKIDVEKWISDILSNYEQLIKNKEIKLSLSKKHQSFVNANTEHFNILFSNLISNAIKYNKKGWTIELIIDKWFVSILDSGIGIKKENLWKVFDSFFMEQEWRTEDSLWIWLSLVRKISEIYSWEIKIDSKPGISTEIKVIF